MEPSPTNIEQHHRSRGPAWKSGRRTIDTLGLVTFHAAFFGAIAWSNPKQFPGVLLLALPILGLDILYYFSPPKQRPSLDPKPDAAAPAMSTEAKSFVFEYLVLLVPPTALTSWFLWLIWTHQKFTVHEQIGVLAGMPVVVGLSSWIIRRRMTRCHLGVKNRATKFIALAVLATWIGATFLFVLLLTCCLLMAGQH